MFFGAVCVLQGCTIGYAMLAALPHMNEKISVMIQIAPGVFRTRSNRLQAPFLKAMASVRTEQVRPAQGRTVPLQRRRW